MTPIQRLPLLALLTTGLLCCLLGAALLLADLSSWQASRFLEDWGKRQGIPSQRAWEVAEAAATRAITSSPAPMASYYEQLGRIHEWRHINRLYGDEEAAQSRQDALEAYRKAIELRPMWPYTWVRLAHVKLRLLSFDDEFDEALRQAVTLGPWRYSVSERIAEIGLIAWAELDASQRELVLDAAERALIQNRRAGARVMEIAKRFHRMNEICAALDREVAEARKVCP